MDSDDEVPIHSRLEKANSWNKSRGTKFHSIIVRHINVVVKAQPISGPPTTERRIYAEIVSVRVVSFIC